MGMSQGYVTGVSHLTLPNRGCFQRGAPSQREIFMT